MYLNIRKNERLCRCPACGSEAGIYVWAHDDSTIVGNGIGDVRCSDIGCSTKPNGKSKRFHFSGKFGIKKAYAVGAWNTYCGMYNEMYRKDD